MSKCERPELRDDQHTNPQSRQKDVGSFRIR